MCESYVQAYSNPCCSASFISSIIRWYGGSGRTVTPKLSIDPPRSLAGERAYRRENGSHLGSVRHHGGSGWAALSGRSTCRLDRGRPAARCRGADRRDRRGPGVYPLILAGLAADRGSAAAMKPTLTHRSARVLAWLERESLPVTVFGLFV